METAPKIPAIMQLIKDGYGEGMLATILETLKWMATAMASDSRITDSEAADILNLLMLEEALLKDCYGIDITVLNVQ